MDNTGMLFSLSIMSDCLQPPRLLCSLDFPAKNAGVGCRFHLQGIFPTQGSNPRLLQIPNHWAGVCGSSCGPGVKTPHFQGKRHRFDPWLGNWDPTCHMALIKKKKEATGETVCSDCCFPSPFPKENRDGKESENLEWSQEQSLPTSLFGTLGVANHGVCGLAPI